MLPLKDSSKTTTNNNVEKSTQSSMKNSTGIITDSKFDKDSVLSLLHDINVL